MATIRAKGAEKQQQGGRSTDDETIIEKVCRHLAEICKLLPVKNPEWRGFARAIFSLKGRLNFADAVVEKAKASQEGGWLLRFG